MPDYSPSPFAMTQAFLSPEEAIFYFQEDHFEGASLAEAFARYPHWQVAVGESDTHYKPLIQQDAQGHSFINLFSKSAYIKPFVEKWGDAYQAKHLAESVGYYIFKHLPKKLSYVNIDPETQHGIHYRKGQIKLLQTMGRMVEADELLAKLSLLNQESKASSKHLIKRLHEYIFHLVMFPDNHIASAPDSYGNKLITAFTSEHAALEYMGWLKFSYPKRNMPVVKEVAGHVLFKRVSQTNLHGVVVNCQGPIRPVTLERSFCGWLGA